jgi:uncharacterized protein (DUF1800 family)
MENNTLTRRQLFQKLIVRLTNNAQDKDPLFEKYSRKIYNGRKYASNFYKNKTTAKNTQTERIKPVTSSTNPYPGTFGTREAIHLLKRTGFGFKIADVDKLAKLSCSDAVNLVLKIDPVTASLPVNYYENEKDNADENKLPYGSTWINDFFPSYDPGNDTNGNRTQSLRAWSLGLALNQDITIREKMTLFWYHFIPIDFETIAQSPNDYANTNSARICYRYMKNFRDNATGNFKQLIRNIATQPAMMFQLNNQANKKGAPDENFAREIQELFTIGKDVPNVYSQADIVQAAKVLTGWRVQDLNTATEKTVFVADRHDTSDKQFSAFFGDTLIKNSGETEIVSFIDMIFSKSEIVSKYICRRLYRFFVYYDIDANIEANVITPLAKLFVDSKWEILPVLESLFKSDHFYDMANRGVYIKTPFDVIIGAMRTFNATHNIADPTNYELQYYVWTNFNWALNDMQQSMGSVPNISGWQAFYQKPSFHEYWINSSSIQKRYGYLEYLLYGIDIEIERNGDKTKIEVDLIAFIQQFPATTCEDPKLLVDECIKYLLPIDLSDDQKSSIKTKSLLSNLGKDDYWTQSWNDYLANTTDMVKADEVKRRLKELIVTIVRLAEYQLM